MKLYRHGWGEFDPNNTWDLQELLLEPRGATNKRPIDDIIMFPSLYLRGEEARFMFESLIGRLLNVEPIEWVMKIQALIDHEVSRRTLKKLRGE